MCVRILLVSPLILTGLLVPGCTKTRADCTSTSQCAQGYFCSPDSNLCELLPQADARSDVDAANTEKADAALPDSSFDAAAQPVRYPTTAAEWAATFPDITVPTALWAMEDSASPATDSIGSVDLFAVDTPIFGTEAEHSQKSVTFDSTLDALLAADVADLQPDEATSMTFMAKVFVPASATGPNGIMAKRGGEDYPGWSLFIGTLGTFVGHFDSGAAERQVQTVHDYRNGWRMVAVVIDRNSQQARLETEKESIPAELSDLGSLASTTAAFSFGRSLGEGRNSVVGLKVAYAAAWQGTALSRKELLSIWEFF